MHKFAIWARRRRLAHHHQHVTLLAHRRYHLSLVPSERQPRRTPRDTPADPGIIVALVFAPIQKRIAVTGGGDVVGGAMGRGVAGFCGGG